MIFPDISIIFEILKHKDYGLADLTQASSLAGLVSMYNKKFPSRLESIPLMELWH